MTGNICPSFLTVLVPVQCCDSKGSLTYSKMEEEAVWFCEAFPFDLWNVECAVGSHDWCDLINVTDTGQFKSAVIKYRIVTRLQVTK